MRQAAGSASSRRSLLILLPNTWPYGAGENFLGDELPYLQEEFERTAVFPVNPLNVSTPLTGSVPEGVMIYPLFETGQGVTSSKPKLALRGLKNFRLPEVKRELDEHASGLKKRGILAYFEGKAEQSFRHIIQELDDIQLVSGFTDSLQEGEHLRIVIYSYWYFVSARVAVRLRTAIEERLADTLPHGVTAEVLAVSRGHGYDLNESVNPGGYLPYRSCLPEVLDQSYPISVFGMRTLQAQAPQAAEKISFARLGTGDDPRAKAAVTAYSSSETFHFVSCAWISPVKRLDLLVEALSRLNDVLASRGQKTAWHWTHLGGGPDLRKLMVLAEEKLPEGSYTISGELKPSDIKDYYATHPCDLFCNVSSSEGVPVSVMEAFCFGIPALATDVGGTGEIVQPGISGHLLPPDPDANLIARRLAEATLRDAATRHNMRLSTRRLWEELCDAEKNYRTFAQMLGGKLPLNGTVPPSGGSEDLHGRQPARGG